MKHTIYIHTLEGDVYVTNNSDDTVIFFGYDHQNKPYHYEDKGYRLVDWAIDHGLEASIERREIEV